MTVLNRQKRPPGLSDIAEKCGVSAATVSRVLNRKNTGFSVRAERREQILETADQLGYRPNINARLMRKKKTKLVAILGFPHSETSFPGTPQSVVCMVVDELHNAGYDAITCYPHPDHGSDELPPWRFDGAVLLTGGGKKQTLKELDRQNRPYVVLNSTGGTSGAQVVVDDAHAMRLALDHLHELGHRHIAFVGNSNAMGGRDPIYQCREDAYRSWMADHGLAEIPISGWFPEKDIENTQVGDYLEEMVRNQHVTAMIAHDHYVAVLLMRYAYKRNLRIPQDLSLLCFNDEYPTHTMPVGLTAVAIPTEKIAQEGVKLLLDQMRNPDDNRGASIIVRAHLVERESTGKCQNPTQFEE